MTAPTRRGLLGGAAVLVAAPMAPVSASPVPRLDAQPIRLGAMLSDAWARDNEAWALAEGEEDDEVPNTVKAVAATAVTGEIVDRIEPLHASTLEGLIVKMRAVLWCRSGSPFTIEDLDRHPNPTVEAKLLAGLIQDLAAMGGIEA